MNRIVHGDCVKVMGAMDDESVDLVITSPPYNLRNTTGAGLRTGGPLQRKPGLQQGYADHDDDMPHADYVAWQRACLTEMLRVIKDDGAIFYNHKWRVQGGLLQDRADIVAGFPVRQIVIWNRRGGINFNESFFLPTYEVIYLIAKPRFKLRREAVKLGDVWTFPPATKHGRHPASRNSHPAPFPVELPARCLRACSGSIVLDPFAGSGTTLLAARQEGWDAIGIDISEEYCRLAEERLAAVLL